MQSLAIALVCAALHCPVTAYDPARDALRDIGEAVAWASVENKRVLLEVGGQWCERCRVLDALFQRSPRLAELRDRAFVTVKINVSPENENREALKAFPAIYSYPHIFVLDKEGRLIKSQELGPVFEDPKMLRAFLESCRRAQPAEDDGPPAAASQDVR